MGHMLLLKRSMLAVVSTAAMIVAAGIPLVGPTQAAPATQPSSVQILSPAPNAVETGDTVAVKVAVKNLDLSCALAGTPPRAGTGHWHLLLDGGLINFECGTAAVLSMQNVTPGKHTITAALAANDYSAIAGK